MYTGTRGGAHTRPGAYARGARPVAVAMPAPWPWPCGPWPDAAIDGGRARVDNLRVLCAVRAAARRLTPEQRRFTVLLLLLLHFCLLVPRRLTPPRSPRQRLQALCGRLIPWQIKSAPQLVLIVAQSKLRKPHDDSGRLPSLVSHQHSTDIIDRLAIERIISLRGRCAY
eukprot:scaffold23788_cov126-Isochrysis_galbana.AAC.3